MHALLRGIVVGAVLGVIWPFALTTLLAFSGNVTIQLTQAAYDLGLDRMSARLTVRGVDALLWSAILGALFGIPLGFVARTRVLAAWLAFLIALLLAGVVNSGIRPVLLEWRVPETWLYVLAVLAVALCTTRLVRPAYATRAMASRQREPQRSVPTA
jgi:hypothetical protein